VSSLLAEPLRNHGPVPSKLMKSLRPLKVFCLSSPSDGEYLGALLAILLKKPLTESLWVFNNPVKITHGPFFDVENSKSSLLSCAFLHTFSTPPDGVSFPQNVQQFWVPSVYPLHLLNALLAELLQNPQ
jgi:hypothetical protein